MSCVLRGRLLPLRFALAGRVCNSRRAPPACPLPCCHRACLPPPLLSLLRRDAWGALKRRLLTPLAAQRALALILPTMPAEDAGELLLAKRFLASVALG